MYTSYEMYKSNLGIINMGVIVNPFHATYLFLYPLKTSKNLCFSDVFSRYRKRKFAYEMG